MTKCRFLGRSCIEIIGIVDHIIIDPHYSIDPKKGITAVFLTHEHDDHCDLEKIKEINLQFKSSEKEIEIYGPKEIKEKYGLELKKVRKDKIIELEDLRIKPFKIECYKSEVCFAYLVKKGNINLLHTADSSNFSRELKEFGENVDYCFIACFKDNYEDYLEFLKLKNPMITFPYHFDLGEEDKAKDLSKFLNEQGIEAQFIEIGTEFEF